MVSFGDGNSSPTPNAFSARFLHASGGYGVVLDDGAVVGHLDLFDEPLVDAVNVAVNLVRSPWSLAYLLEAAGPLCLERCGALLDRRVSEEAGR